MPLEVTLLTPGFTPICETRLPISTFPTLIYWSVVELALMNEQRVGSREVKTICWSKVQGALFARRQMGGLAGATPLIWTSSVSPRMSITGGLGRGGWGQICYWRSVSLNSHSYHRPPREVMSGEAVTTNLRSTLMMGSYTLAEISNH